MSHRQWVLGTVAASSTLALSAAAAAQTASDPTTIEEVVVTAQKREEKLKDVPISVSVVGAAQLDRQNVSSLNDLTRTAPSLNVNGGSLGIRGVSTNGYARSSESAVSVVLDGVVLGRAQIDTLFDIERVEVLSGPQGMLFGKNASAGVINVVTKAPDPTKFETILHADLGNYEYHRDRATVNVPLASNAAVRIGAHYDHSGGFIHNTRSGNSNDLYSYGTRARLLWDVSDNLRINLIGDYDKSGGDGESLFTFGLPGAAPLTARQAACGIVASLDNDKTCSEGVNGITQRDVRKGLSAQIDYTLPGDYVLTSITAGRRREQGDIDYKGKGGDSDLLNIDILSTNLTPNVIKSFSQELRLTSPAGRKVDFVAGLYYSDTQTNDVTIQGGTLGLVPAPLRIGRVAIVDTYSRSYAAFGQATLNATDQLRFILGARYTDEVLKDNAKSLTNTTTPSTADYGLIYSPLFVLAPVSEKVKNDNISWRLGVQYDVTPDVMTYATASRGYKGPAVNDQASPPLVQPIIQPEKPMYYELGAKGVFLEGRLLATAALFHNKVENFQTAVFVPASAANPVPGFSQGNAPYMTSKGFEVSVSGQPARGLNLNGGLLYNDASYSSDFVVACAPGVAPGTGSCSAQGTTSPNSQVANTPKWRATLNGEYAHEVADNLTGFVQADLVFQTKINFSPTPNPITTSGDQWLLGGRVGVRTSDGQYGVSLWGRNLLDKTYPSLTADPLSFFNGGGAGSYLMGQSINRHRTFGLSLDARF